MRSRGKTVQPRFWCLLIAFLIIVLCVVYFDQEKTIALQDDTIATLRETYAQLSLDAQDAERREQFSKTDEFIIRMANAEYNMILPGEVLYVTSK